MNKLIKTLLLVLFCVLPVLASDDYGLESDITFGYRFIFNDKNPYYRNHDNVHDMWVLDDFHMLLTKDSKWYDKISLDGEANSREDYSRTVRFSIQKQGKYEATLRFNSWNDFFEDPTYNYGNNTRDLFRTNLQADFYWKGVKHFIFSAGYGTVRSKGYGAFSDFYWGDAFRIPVHQNYDREELRAGVDFNYQGFFANYHQTWMRIENKSSFMPDIVQGFGYSAWPTFMVNSTHSQLTKSKIPVYDFKTGYTGDKCSTDFRYSVRDGRIDNDIVDLKTFYFSGHTGRSDILVKALGTSNIPENEAQFRLDYTPYKEITFEYQYTWNKLKTDTSQGLSEQIGLLGNTGVPVIIAADSYQDLYYYENKKRVHRFAVTLRPTRRISVTGDYQRIDGNLRQDFLRDADTLSYIDDKYKNDRFQIAARYKARCGTELSGSYTRERIDDPTFMNAGHYRNDWKFSATQPMGERFTLSGTYQDNHLMDDRVNLNNRVKMYDISAYYIPKKDYFLGGGYTRFDLRWAQDFFYTLNQASTVQNETYTTNQNSYYFSVGINGDHRITGNAALYYMEDTGRSLPCNRWSPAANLQFKLAKHWFAQLNLRHFNYYDKLFLTRNYSYDQLTLALRWKF